MGLRHGSGAKKAAHYSLARVRGLAALTLLAAGLAGLAGAAGPRPEKPEADARKAEAELSAVKSEIERVTRQVSDAQVERDRLTRDLKSAELSVGHAREALSDLKHQRAQHAARRGQLAAEQREREAQLDK